MGQRNPYRPGKITAEEAKLHAETQFEKYRIVQDQLFVSDFDRFLADQDTPLHLPPVDKIQKATK